MTLRTKVLLTLVVTILVFSALGVGIVDKLVYSAFADLEHEQAHRELLQCKQAIDSDLALLDGACLGWSSWDDTYEFVENPNQTYIDINLVPESFSQNNLNLIAIYDSEGRSVWSKLIGPETDSVINIPGLSPEVIASRCQFGTGDPIDSAEWDVGTAGLLQSNHGALLVAARPILTSSFTGPSRGHFVMGRFVSKEAIHKWSTHDNAILGVFPLTGSPLPSKEEEAVARLTSGTKECSLAQTDEVTRCYAIYPDIDGNPGLLIRADLPRTVTMKGLMLTKVGWIAIAFVGLVCLAVLSAMLRHLVLKPIARLTEHVAKLGTSDKIHSDFESTSNDEIGVLGMEFNRMATRLADALDKLTHRTGELKLANLQLGDDILTKHLREQELKVSKTKLERAMEVARLGTWEMDLSTRMLHGSAELFRIFGLPEDSPSLPTTDALTMILKDDAPVMLAGLKRLVDDGITLNDEFHFEKPNGELGLFHTIAKLITNDNGVPVKVAGVIQDVTARSLVQQELKESEERLKTVLDSLNAGVVMIDAETHRVVDVNDAATRMLGLSREQITGQLCHKFICPAERGKCPITDLGKRVDSAEREMVSADGTHIPILKTVTPMTFSGKNYLLETFMDITERKRDQELREQLQDKLERAERMESLGILAGGVAHDLNNMLGPLVGYPELMLLKLPQNSPMRKQVERMERSAKDAAEVIQDLLTLARRGRYNMAPTDINQIVRDYLDSPGYEKLVKSRKDVQIELSLDGHLAGITGSAPHLSKVVMNLIVNAADAMPEGGTISVKTDQLVLDRLLSGYDKIESGKYVVLRVKDTGTGIAEEDIEKIFEPYFSKKVMGTSGSGLGLSVVYGIVKDHKGYYDIFSELGEGTEFVLYFPVSEEEAEKRGQSREQERGTERILVVDDVPEQCDVARALLGSLGYETATVKSGEEAINYVADHEVDLVLLDMILTDQCDGLDTFRQIQAIRPEAKVIIASGYSATERVAKMQQLGAGQFIRKPYTRGILAKAIREELSGTPAAQPSV